METALTSSSPPNLGAELPSNAPASSTPDLGVELPSDTEAPVITLNGENPANIKVGDTYSDLGGTVVDNISLNLGIHASLDNGPTTTPELISINTTEAGTHTILYSATDQAGNIGLATRVVNMDALVDTVATSTPTADATTTPAI